MEQTIIGYLESYREPEPQWLANYRAGDKVPFNEVIGGRIGYYPGCGSDGQLIRLCNQANAVHVYLYVDYLVQRADLPETLPVKGKSAIRGYHVVGIMEYGQNDILPNGPYTYVTRANPTRSDPTTFLDETYEWYCLMYVWERDADRPDSWGAHRFATIFLCDDGISAYYQLFVREYRKAPWIILLQDHGFGCNYDSFGRGGLLDEIISTSGVYPPFVILGSGTRIWRYYAPVGCKPDIGGMHHVPRALYRHDSGKMLSFPSGMQTDRTSNEQHGRSPLCHKFHEWGTSLPDDERRALKISDIQREFHIEYTHASYLMEGMKGDSHESD